MSIAWSITQCASSRRPPLYTVLDHAAWTIRGSHESCGLRSSLLTINIRLPAIPALSKIYPKSTLELAAKSEMHKVYLIPTLTLRRTMWTYSNYFRPPDSQVQHLDHRSESPSRHLVDRAIRRPPPNLLPIKVQRHRTKEQTSKVQSQDSHKRTNIPIPRDPIVEIPRHPIAEHVLEHRSADQELAGRGLVAINL